jgi:hypothetical protein
MNAHRAIMLSIYLLAGCATRALPPLIPQQGDFGTEQSFSGVLALGFERQSLDGCWLEFAGSAQTDLQRLAPSPAMADSLAPYSADVTLIGRRRAVINVTGDDLGGQGFGHLSMYPCLIEATRVSAAHLR